MLALTWTAGARFLSLQMQVCALNNQTGRSLKGIVPTFILLSFLEMGFGEGKGRRSARGSRLLQKEMLWMYTGKGVPV